MREITVGRTRSRVPTDTKRTNLVYRERVGRNYNEGKYIAPEVVKTLPDRMLINADETTYDNVVPNFNELRDRGTIVMNDYQHHEETATFLPGKFVAYRLDEGWHTYYNYDYNIADVLPLSKWPTFQVGWDIDHLANIALTKLYAKIDAAPIQSIVSIAEFHKTVASLRAAFIGVLRAIRGIHRIRRLLLRGAITSAKAANMYLEVRYGLRPIYYDVISAVEALNSYGKVKRKRYCAMAADTKTDQENFSVYYANNYEATGRCTLNASLTVLAGAIVDGKLSTNGLIDVAGLDEIPGSLWELVPFSFIVDWFVNVGDFIAAYTPKPDVDIKGTWVTVRDRRTRTAQCYTYRDLYDFQSCGSVGINGTYVENTTTRYANPEKPQLPQFNIRLNWLKILDLLAILRTNASTFRRWRL